MLEPLLLLASFLVGIAPSQRRVQPVLQLAGVEGGGSHMVQDGSDDDDADWACLVEGIAEAVSEALSDEFSEYAHASMRDDVRKSAS